MNPFTIERQEHTDALAMGQQSPYRAVAVEHIQAGGIVKVIQNGVLIGHASTVEELDSLLWQMPGR